MSFNSLHSQLPVVQVIPALRQALEGKNTLVLSAPPGAGKSTLLPLALKDESWLQGQKILMLEPRRLAARAVATRMAEMLGEEAGETIGYRIRFENKISSNTKVEVLTEGILTRMLQSDNTLEGVGLVIFDEFHERSIHADLALALCREAQQVLRPDLRILIMSATLDTEGLCRMLDAPLISSAGKAYPVDIRYGQEADERMLPELMARQVLTCLMAEKGDILAFLPGEAEIVKCAALLEKEALDLAIYPLFGQLPPAKQKQALLPDKAGRRKVVLATSIAETSLTIGGVRIVIDSGFTRKLQFDPGTGLSRLVTVRITADAAEQRAGRAGRTEPGSCYRMWTLATQQRLDARRVPEIMEADLSGLVLELASWGCLRPTDLSWIDLPPAAAYEQSRQLLEELEALEGGKISEHGKQLLRMPCHPRLAHMLLKAESNEQKALAADLAAVLDNRDPLGREAGADITLRIEKLRRTRTGQTNRDGRWVQITKSATSFCKLLGINEDKGQVDPYETGLLLAFAFPERIASARPGNNAQFQLSNGRLAMISHQDPLAHEPWLAVAHLDMREGMGKIFLAAPIHPGDLIHRVKEQEVIVWDTRKGGLVNSQDLRLGSLVLKSKPLTNPDPARVKAAILAAIQRDGEQLLNWDAAVSSLQNRMFCMSAWNGSSDCPDISTTALLNHLEAWFNAPLDKVKKNEDLQRIALRPLIEQWLGWERMQELNHKLPEKIQVPSGSSLPISYLPTGAAPVLSVRLQEVFGMADTPRINEGKTPLLLHLLSPGYKPVQVTADLRSFWNSTYFEVRKELKRRYPKHAWPDDPWTAIPVAKGRPTKKG
ncbi:MAG: ATP-dependent helicase HrpB [Bacteroidia bacterium]|nr:ATP-dependent helicase HrpB [Bacteroidia bacterium]